MWTLSSLVQAISAGEGFGASPTNRPTRNNNPGDLTGSGYPGQIGTDAGGFAIFSSAAAGQAALQQYLSSHLAAVGSGSGPYAALGPNSTFQDFLDIYAGNPGSGYVQTVASRSGIAPSTPLGQLLASLGAGAANGSAGPATVAVNATPATAESLLQDIVTGGGSAGGEAIPAGFSPGVLVAGAVLGTGLLIWAMG